MNRKDIRNAALCALVVLAAFFLTNPFVQIPFNDDWTYSFTVRELLRTGQFTYHCGESAAFLTQACWGALSARVFGFSFVTLRLSTLPWAMGSAFLCYLLARRANLQTAWAIFATLLLALSPLFLPLASSFMTDVPALFFVLLSIYGFVIASDSQRPWIALSVAYGVALVGGLSRQIVWIVPVTSGPWIMWVKRNDRSVVAISILGITINLIAAYVCSKWFYAQPFVVSEWSFAKTIEVAGQAWADSLILWLCIWLTTLLLILPATLPTAWNSLARTCSNLRTRRGAFAAIIAVAICLLSLHWPGIAVEPWLGDVVSPRGPLSGMELSGFRPVSQPPLLREILGLLVVIVAWALLTDLADQLSRPGLLRRITSANQPVAISLVLFAAGYLALLAYRAPRGFIYDRYALPLIPCAAIPLLLKSQRSSLPPTIIAWTMLALWSIYSIAATQDVHALQQARRTAMDRLLSAGNPDTSIADGSEFDNWTQLLHQGYVNIPGINSPPGTYDPALGICPALRPLYRVEFRPAPDTTPSEFGTIDYISWLPPFHRRIFIDRFRDPYWLDPDNKTPPPKDFEDFHMH